MNWAFLTFNLHVFNLHFTEYYFGDKTSGICHERQIM